MARIPEPFIRQDYRGLKTSEDDLLRTYLRQTGDDVVGLETDIGLGPGEQLSEAQPEEFQRAWQDSSRFRADAVVERRGTLEIVELKDFIRTSALGQLLSYRYWYSVEQDPEKPVELVATAPDLNPSAVQPYRFHGVRIHPQTNAGRVRYEKGLNAQPPFG